MSLSVAVYNLFHVDLMHSIERIPFYFALRHFDVSLFYVNFTSSETTEG